MKEGIHPKYEQTTIRCACGEIIETGSTKKDYLSFYLNISDKNDASHFFIKN